MKLIDLGWCMARLDMERGRLIICSPSDGSADPWTPAESVSIYGEPNLLALRDALNEAYPVVPTGTRSGGEEKTPIA